MEKIIDILKAINPDVDFENEEDIFEDGYISSLDIITIVAEINHELGVLIPPEEIVPENFCSAKVIAALVERLDEE